MPVPKDHPMPEDYPIPEDLSIPWWLDRRNPKVRAWLQIEADKRVSKTAPASRSKRNP